MKKKAPDSSGVVVGVFFCGGWGGGNWLLTIRTAVGQWRSVTWRRRQRLEGAPGTIRGGRIGAGWRTSDTAGTRRSQWSSVHLRRPPPCSRRHARRACDECSQRGGELIRNSERTARRETDQGRTRARVFSSPFFAFFFYVELSISVGFFYFISFFCI